MRGSCIAKLRSIFVYFLLAEIAGSVQINLLLCEKSFNCFRHPHECVGDDCEAIATFVYIKESERVEIELWSNPSKKWVAFGQRPNSDKDFMVAIRGEYCSRSSDSNVLFGHFDGNSLTKNDPPMWTKKTNNVNLLTTSTDGGNLYCKFDRPLFVAADNENLYSMNNTLSAAISFGDELNHHSEPKYHGWQHYSTSTSVDFWKLERIVEKVSSEKLLIGHGILMVFAWLMFATYGIFMSRYMKPIFIKKICGKNLWFRLHQIFMSLTFLCFGAGFVLILIKTEAHWHAGLHEWFGLVAIILGILQPILALFRCDQDHERRFLFNWVHRVVGIGAWVVAAVAVIFGLQKLSIDHVLIIIFIVVTVMLCALLDVLVYFKESKSKGSASYQTDTGVSVDPKVKDNTSKSYILKLIFMVVIYLFAGAIAIYHAVKIADVM